ncbi:MAG: T9SS type A sorting domain-containing protein [Ignavibacteria bacterium]|nr:T9SS type A sorting domain-containing protein [Ignavibacteria bacterium]
MIAGAIGTLPITIGRVFFFKIDDSGNYTKPIILKTNDNVYYGDFDILGSNKLVFTMSIDSVNGIMSGKSLIADTLGNILHQKIFPTSDFIEFKSIQLIDNGDLIFAGIAGFYIPGSEQVGYVVRTDSFLNFKTTSIQNYNLLVADKFELYQNFPNPFNPVTKITFSIPVSGNISIKVYDITGKEIKTLVNEFRNAGTYDTEFNGADLSSGVYYYKMETGSFTEIKKMILIK